MMFPDEPKRPKVGDDVRIKGAWGVPDFWVTLTKELVYGVDHFWETTGGGSWIGSFGKDRQAVVNLKDILEIKEKTA